VLAIGKLYGDSCCRWISIGPVGFQPSEISKLTLILFLVRYFSVRNQRLILLKDLIVPASVSGLTFILIFLEPDLGTAVIIFLIFLCFCFFVNTKRRYTIGLISAILVCLPIFWFLLRDYQKERVLSFLNPQRDPLKSGYHTIQSRIAIGSGGLWGKGFMKGTQTRLQFLPEHHTDFVFSVWAEEWGFIGSIGVILLFFLFISRGYWIAIKAKNIQGHLLGLGIVWLFFLEIFINIGMSIGILPVVGMPLPFFSYGGTSVVTHLVCVGLLLNIYTRRFQFE